MNDINNNKELAVYSQEAGLRLDHILIRIIPKAGLRERRRLCETKRVFVNGHIADASYKVREGDIVSLQEQMDKIKFNSEHELLPRVLKKAELFAFILKPAGMHTENIAGKLDITLENFLPEILSESLPIQSILTRLDFATSGIVTIALTEKGKKIYKELQDQGKIRKNYLALLEGKLIQPIYAAQSLLLKNPQRVLALPKPHPDIKRHTAIIPIAAIKTQEVIDTLGISDWTGNPPSYITLAKCSILKGSRHQIRVHTSSYGFPILGDKKYNAQYTPSSENGEKFYLHHYFLSMDQDCIVSFPPWLSCLGNEIENTVKNLS